MNYFKNKAVQKLLLTFSSRGFSAGGTLLLTFSLGHLLGASGTGLFMIGFSTMMGLKAIGCLGVENAILRFGGKAWGDNDIDELSYFYTLSISMIFIICIPIAVMFFLFSGVVSEKLFSSNELNYIFKLVAVAYPFLVISAATCSWMRACGFPELSSFFEVGSISLFLSVIMWGVYFLGGGDLLTPSFAMCIFLIVVIIEAVLGISILTFIFNIKIKFKKGREKIKLLVQSLLDYFCIDFVFYITQWGAVILLGVFSSSAEVGIFTIAHRLAFTINFILNVFESIVAPKFSYLYSKNDKKSFKKLAHDTTKYMSILAFPITLLMILFPGYILSFWGNDFVKGKFILMLLALSQFVNIATGPVAFILCMTGFQKQLKHILICSLIVGSIGYITLTPLLEGEGAALAILFTVLVQNIIPVFFVKKIFGINTILWWR